MLRLCSLVFGLSTVGNEAAKRRSLAYWTSTEVVLVMTFLGSAMRSVSYEEPLENLLLEQSAGYVVEILDPGITRGDCGTRRIGMP